MDYTIKLKTRFDAAIEYINSLSNLLKDGDIMPEIIHPEMRRHESPQLRAEPISSPPLSEISGRNSVHPPVVNFAHSPESGFSSISNSSETAHNDIHLESPQALKSSPLVATGHLPSGMLNKKYEI